MKMNTRLQRFLDTSSPNRFFVGIVSGVVIAAPIWAFILWLVFY